MKRRQQGKNHCGLTFVAAGAETNGKYFLSETVVPRGDTGPPMHAHSKWHEGFCLKRGHLTFIVEGSEIKLGEGEFLNIQRGVKHTWKNESDVDAEFVVTFAPAGMEAMFVELEGNMSELKEIGKKHGTEFDV